MQLPIADPKYPELEEVAERLKSFDCEVYRDPSARNAAAVKLALQSVLTPK